MDEANSASAAIDLYVARENPSLVRVMDALRSLVKKVVPGSREAINPWGVPIFEWNGPLCYLRVGKTHVTFGFPRVPRSRIPENFSKAKATICATSRSRTSLKCATPI